MREFAIGVAVGVSSHLLTDLCQSANGYTEWGQANFHGPIVRGMSGAIAVLWMLGNALLAGALGYGAAGRDPILLQMERRGGWRA